MTVAEADFSHHVDIANAAIVTWTATQMKRSCTKGETYYAMQHATAVVAALRDAGLLAEAVGVKSPATPTDDKPTGCEHCDCSCGGCSQTCQGAPIDSAPTVRYDPELGLPYWPEGAPPC